jgi:hypothetical protein
MRLASLILIGSSLLAAIPAVQAAQAEIKKVLPHFLDHKGRHTLSPSLYERDAYQAYLREHPEEISAMRFDIQWDAWDVDDAELRLRIALRTTKGNPEKPHLLEKSVEKESWFSTWSKLELEAETMKELGEVIAWRATIRHGKHVIAEQKSFLW